MDILRRLHELIDRLPSSSPRIWIPEERISHHIQIFGSTGVGKSLLIRMLVRQLIKRGMPCVFMDPKRELLEEFYVDGRDYLIDFADERCVRWRLDKEPEDEPHAMAIAEGAFPDRPGDSYFFKDHARALLAYLIGVYTPTTSELARWMADPQLIDQRVAKTEHESTLSKNSPEQRNGILGTLNHLGRALRWMPNEEGRREFSVREWAHKRDGHIFLSSTATTFAALRPLHSLMLDMCLLAMQTYHGPGAVIADELGMYQRLPQMERALSMQRSSGNPIIMAYQSISQLEHAYGDKLAESITSNPYTNIVFRTKGRSAEHASRLLGHPAQLERIRESKSAFRFWGRNYTAERVMDAPVTPGELESQEDRHAFISQAGIINRLHIPWIPPVKRAPAVIRRILAPTNPTLLTPAPGSTDKKSPVKRYFKPKQLKLNEDTAS